MLISTETKLKWNNRKKITILSLRIRQQYNKAIDPRINPYAQTRLSGFQHIIQHRANNVKLHSAWPNANSFNAVSIAFSWYNPPPPPNFNCNHEKQVNAKMIALTASVLLPSSFRFITVLWLLFNSGTASVTHARVVLCGNRRRIAPLWNYLSCYILNCPASEEVTGTFLTEQVVALECATMGLSDTCFHIF